MAEERHYRFKLIIEPCEEGGFIGSCPALDGCFVQGETFEETLSELKAAIDGHIELRLERGEPIPVDVAVEEYDAATVEEYDAVIAA